jgi:hypothetical protein
VIFWDSFSSHIADFNVTDWYFDNNNFKKVLNIVLVLPHSAFALLIADGCTS